MSDMPEESGNTLELRGVEVAVGDVVICRDIDLVVPGGQLHVLFGPNGSGKSSLLAAIMGLPPFRVSSGEILFRGARIDGLRIDERAALGLGMSFQRPPSLSGVSVREFSDAIGGDTGVLDREAAAIDLSGFAGRDINSGFSGGEIKRWEILKLFIQQPDFCLIDEPESGVDLEHIAAVGGAIDRLIGAPGRDGSARSALVITHTGFVLDYVNAQTGHLMIGGRLVESGDAREMFTRIQQHGYRAPVGTDIEK